MFCADLLSDLCAIGILKFSRSGYIHPANKETTEQEKTAKVSQIVIGISRRLHTSDTEYTDTEKIVA